MRNILILAAVFTFGLAFLASTANAQTFEVGAKIGIWAADELDTAAPPGEENDSTNAIYGLVGQYNINDMFSVRLDIEFGSTDFLDSTIFTISGIYNFMPKEDSPWVPYGRLGIVIGDIDLDYLSAPDFDTEFGFEAAAGVSYIYENWKFFGEVGYRSLSFDGLDSLTADIDMNGIIFNVGALYIF